jgi:sterol desaturase/sphingolipid hydroxylase (fatty acid hydroxylase superfamily)
VTGTALGAALGGAMTWTLLEYLIHRYMGHDRRFKRTPFGIEHRRHHVEGDYFAPAWKKAVAATVFTAILSAIAVPLVGAAIGLAYIAGLIASYASYEILHRREHTSAGIGPYARWARRHHFYHHFVDGRVNHGVTSPLWDFAFGTDRKPGVIRVPPKLCMTWLRDPATGNIRAEHAQRYVLGKAAGGVS